MNRHWLAWCALAFPLAAAAAPGDAAIAMKATIAGKAVTVSHGRALETKPGRWRVELSAHALPCGDAPAKAPAVLVFVKDGKLDMVGWATSDQTIMTRSGTLDFTAAGERVAGKLSAPLSEGMAAEGTFDVAVCRPVAKVERVFAAVAKGDPTLGPADAPVTIVSFYSRCPLCGNNSALREELLARYGRDVRWVEKLASPFNDFRDVLVACAVAKLGKFREYDLAVTGALFDPTTFKTKYPRDYSEGADPESIASSPDPAWLASAIAATKLPRKKVVELALGDACNDVVEDAEHLRERIGKSVPRMFVNGRLVSDRTKVTALVDEELAHAKQVIAGGVKPKDLYLHLLRDAVLELPR